MHTRALQYTRNAHTHAPQQAVVATYGHWSSTAAPGLELASRPTVAAATDEPSENLAESGRPCAPALSRRPVFTHILRVHMWTTRTPTCRRMVCRACLTVDALSLNAPFTTRHWSVALFENDRHCMVKGAWRTRALALRHPP